MIGSTDAVAFYMDKPVDSITEIRLELVRARGPASHSSCCIEQLELSRLSKLRKQGLTQNRLNTCVGCICTAR